MAAVPAPLLEATIRHQVYLERLKSGEVKKFGPFLAEIDRRLREILTRNEITTYQRGRVEALLAEVSAAMTAVLGRFRDGLQRDLFDIATYEAGFEARSLAQSVPAATFTEPAPAQLWAAVTSAPMSVRGYGQGKLLEPFLRDWERSEIEKVTGIIRQGFFEGQTNAQIVRDIRGTAALRYKDGELAAINRHAETIVRTSVQHVASEARVQTWKDNANLVKSYRWTSVLDSRTSEQCQSLDGRAFKVGEGPVPPIHPNCRSTTVAVLDSRFDFLDAGATRASADGQVPSSETYFTWLKSQSLEFQDSVLGPSRGRLFRDGGMSAERFSALQLDRNFQALTLEEMKQLEPLAFRRAGLD